MTEANLWEVKLYLRRERRVGLFWRHKQIMDAHRYTQHVAGALEQAQAFGIDLMRDAPSFLGFPPRHCRYITTILAMQRDNVGGGENMENPEYSELSDDEER